MYSNQLVICGENPPIISTPYISVLGDLLVHSATSHHVENTSYYRLYVYSSILCAYSKKICEDCTVWGGGGEGKTQVYPDDGLKIL
jgi:hypothetical protein